MLENATILRIDRKAGDDPAGEPIIAGGGPVSVRCYAEPVVNQRFTAGAGISDASAMLFIPQDNMAAAGEKKPNQRDRITYLMDGESDAATQEVIEAKNFSQN